MSLLIPDVAESLNTLLDSSTGDQTGIANRVPFIFTSDKRLSLLRDGRRVLDNPSIFPLINMMVNPSSVRFRQGKRITKKDTQEGSVFFHFTNKDGQNNDILYMSFAGTTGYIDRRGSQPTSIQHDKVLGVEGLDIAEDTGFVNTGSTTKILIWHNLYNLTREQMLLDNNRENRFHIFYISKLFPIMIKFTGHFNTLLDFSEEGAKPNSSDYTFEFTVEDTQPSLDELIPQIATQLQRFQTPANPTGSSVIPAITPASLL